MKRAIIFFSCIATIMACSPAKQKVEQVSNIDSTLQTKATSILGNKLSEINAQFGQAIIMEVQTGQIKVLVGLERKDSANYQPCTNFSQVHESGLIQPISILAALETEKVRLDDMVDVGNGIYIYKGDTIKDHNWHRGGYGRMTIKQGIANSSNITTVKTILRAFKDSPMDYMIRLHQMGMGDLENMKGFEGLQSVDFKTKDSIWHDTDLIYACMGYNQSIAPIQMLTIYNAIANNGTMIQPQLYKDSTIVINPQIANTANIDSLKQALQYVVTDGLGKMAHSDKVQVAGKTGTVQLNDESYVVEFCGYFPANNPQYTIIVSINKEELPASGGLMAGDVFKQIVDYMN